MVAARVGLLRPGGRGAHKLVRWTFLSYNPEAEDVLRDVWEAGDERKFVLEGLRTGCEVRKGCLRGTNPQKEEEEELP